MVAMKKNLLTRRQFAARGAAFGLSLPVLAAMRTARAGTEAPVTGAPVKPAARTVRLPDGTAVTALGQGCWHLGQGRHPAAVEEEALRTGISLGMNLLDTSGNYGRGRSEELLSHVLAGERERISWSRRSRATKSPVTASRAPARRASRVSAPAISICIRCTGRSRARIPRGGGRFEHLARRQDPRLRRFQLQRRQMEICSASRTDSAAPPISSRTSSAPPVRAACCPGAPSATCR